MSTRGWTSPTRPPSVRGTKMPLWGWVLIGLGGWLLVGVVLAVVLGRVLGRIGREVTALHDLLDSEVWATRPLDRAPEGEKEPDSSSPTFRTRRARSRRRSR